MNQLEINHSEELAEMQSYGNNIKDFYYSHDSESWVLQFKKGDSMNFEEKRGMMEFIYTEGIQ